MPITYYTEEELQEYTRLLAECHEHIAHGSATENAKQYMLDKIALKLGWRKPNYDPAFDPATFNN